jgi:HlyD family secretion protein
MLRWLLLLVLLGLLAGGGWYYRQFAGRDSHEQAFRTEKATRGDLHVTVGATGTLEPEEVVDVGAQVVGRIKELGEDPRSKSDPKFTGKTVDYGSPVDKGMILAKIDDSTYKAQNDQAEANLAQAKANVAQMEAQVMQTQAEWERAQKLKDLKIPTRTPTGDAHPAESMPIKGISDADYILAEANAESAKANLEAAKATVLQTTAALTLARTNLGYTTIPSPIDGTVIDRRVNIGQTVVSSLNAPSLFLLARDLHKMQVWASVNEADIARIKSGTKVHFRVDALPDDVFHGLVTQIRLNASMTQNVVTYTVVISVDNPDLKLLPYLTADVKFEVDDRQDAILVPNAALRYRPAPELLADDAAGGEVDATKGDAGKDAATKDGADKEGAPKDGASKDGAGGGQAAVGQGSAAGGSPAAGQGGRAGRQGRHEGGAGHSNVGKLWRVGDDGKLQPVEVQVGLSDGALTEITSGDVHEGDEFVTGEARPVAAASGEVNNPFAPPRFGGRRR